MSSTQLLRQIRNWHPTKNIRVQVLEVFEHKGEVHASDEQKYFFDTEEELRNFHNSMMLRATGDGPITINITVSDFKPNGRFLETREITNYDYWQVILPQRLREKYGKNKAA